MSQENEPKIVSRRDFLRKTALASAGVAVLATGCAPKVANDDNAPVTSQNNTQNIKWTKEVDVVVVGSGTVIFAALAAKNAGAESVLVIEKNVAFGGTSALSGGGFWIPMNYAMAAAGVEDNREDAFKYLKTISAGQSTDTLINAFLDNAPKMLEWSRDAFGFQWLTTAGKSYQDYYEVPGFRPYGRQVNLAKEGKNASGGTAWQIIHDTIDSLGIEVMLETAAKELFTNEAGEVIGVRAAGANGEITIKAKKGVILGTGGFDFNRDMTAAFLRGPIFATNAVPTNTGDGHLMAMKLGADLRNMQSCWGLPFFPIDEENLRGEADWQIYRGKPGSIVVNKYGERIGNEASAYHVFNKSFWSYDSGKFEWRNTPSYWIADAGFAANYFFPGSGYQTGVIPDTITQANTLEELCDKLGVDKEGLKTTLAVFNENAANGIDPIWHRGEYQFDINTAGDYLGRTDIKNVCLAPIATGPFYGSRYVPGTCGTNGGLRINENAQVLNVAGNPIPRLYAVGNTSGSVMGDGYPGGGGTLGAGSVFAMLAARHAVGLESL